MTLGSVKLALSHFSNFFENGQNCFHFWMQSWFEVIGRHVARRPVRTIIVSIFATFVIGAITILMGSWETRMEYRETMHGSTSFRTYIGIILPFFGDLPRRSELHMMSSTYQSMLLKENLLASLQLQDDVLKLQASAENGNVVSFDGVCFRTSVGSSCAYESIFTRMRWNATLLESMSQETINKALIDASSNPDVSVENFVGKVKIENDGKTITGGSLRFFFYGLNPSAPVTSIFDAVRGKVASKDLENVLLWEKKFLQYSCSGVICPSDIQQMSSWNRSDYNIIAISLRSFADEVNRNSSSSLAYMVSAIILILIVMWIMLSGKPLRHSRFALGTGAIVMIIFSLIIGFGISSLVGVPLSDLSLILIFVVVGVGIDDVVILVDFLDRRRISKLSSRHSQIESDLNDIELIAKAVGDAGTSIFLTSSTNLLAFLVAATAGYAGARWVSITGGIVLFVLFVLTITFFTAILTIDHMRYTGNRLDLLCCITYDDKEDSNNKEKDKNEGEKDEEVPDTASEGKLKNHACIYGDSCEEKKDESSSEYLDQVLPAKSEEGSTTDEKELGTSNANVKSTKTFFSNFILGWTRLLSNKVLSGAMIVAFISLIPIGFLSVMPKLKVGSEIQDYFPDDSYYSTFIDHVKNSHESISAQTVFIVSDVNFGNPGTRKEIIKIVSALNSDSLVLSPYQSVFQDFDDFLDNLSAFSGQNSTGYSVFPNESIFQDYNRYATLLPSHDDSTEAYYEKLNSFLQITSPICVKMSTPSKESMLDFSCKRVVIPADYQGDIIWTNENGGKKSIKIARMLGVMSYSVHTYRSSIKMNQHRETLKNVLGSLQSKEFTDKSVKLWSLGWMAFDKEAKMKVMTVETLVFAALTVLVAVSIFLHPLSVLIIATGIASINGALFIIMHLSGVSIDAAAFLCITMSIGFSVDYSVHVAHAYEHSGSSKATADLAVEERLAKSLSGVGKSVAKGGVSTFTGIFVLAFAKAKIFRTFFKLLFSTVLLGLSVSFVFFPACIIFVGKWIKVRKR